MGDQSRFMTLSVSAVGVTHADRSGFRRDISQCTRTGFRRQASDQG